MATRWAMLLVSVSGCSAMVQAKGPLLTTDLIYGTYDLFSQACTSVYTKAGVDKLIAQVPTDVLKKQVDEQMKKLPPLPPQVMEAQVKVVQVKAMALEQVEKVYEPADKLAETVVTQVETFVPAFKGTIGKGAGNLAFFAGYMCAVLYVTFKVAFFVLRLALKIFCCICCCGCCCRGRSGSGESAKAKKNGKAAPAAKGKAAPASNGKSDAKVNGKKK